MLDPSSCGDGGLICGDGIPIGSGHLPRAVGLVHGDVLAKVAEKMFLFGFGAQALLVPFQSRQGKQGLLGCHQVLIDDDLVQENPGYFIFLDTSNRDVLRPVLPYAVLVVSLRRVSTTCSGLPMAVQTLSISTSEQTSSYAANSARESR